MAKGKKRRQEDFQKVKLKVGKKLKKGENVTNASFKTRTVQIVQQLKGENKAGPSTKKKQNIQEVVTQCRHYNANVRQEAINGLREIVSSFPEILTTHLSDILEKSAELLQDKEPPVRQGSLRLFKTVFPRVAEKQISPFFSMVCAHLCCAMTHISSDIQVDSLNMFDLLLEFYPKLIIRNAAQVMTNFIEQISRQKGEGGRSLSSNLGQKMTSVKWRTSVLGRIEKFLAAFLDYRNDQQSTTVPVSNVMWFTESESNYFQVFPNYIKNQWENPGFILRSLNEAANVQDDLDSRFYSFVDTLIPLLLECWIEASPVHIQANEKDDTVLTASSVFTLSSILNVTKLLLECVECLKVDELESRSLVTSKQLKDFLQRLFNGFPYSLQEMGRKEQKKKFNDNEVEATLYLLNLSICEVLSYCISYKRIDVQPHWLTDTLSYTQDFLKNDNHSNKGCKTMVRIVQRLQKAGIESDRLVDVMSAMFRRFRKSNSLSQEKKIYLQFFSNLVFDRSTVDKISENLQEQFLQCLPELLPLAAKESSHMVAPLIQSLKVAANRNHLSFLGVEFFSKHGQTWFGVDEGAIVSLCDLDQRELLSLLYFVPEIDMNMIKLLTYLVRSEKISDKNVSYLIQCLHNRFVKSCKTTTECSIHVTFMVNLILGDAQSLEMSDMDMSSIPPLGKYYVVDTQPSEGRCWLSWPRHELLVQESLKKINMVPNRTQVKSLVLSYIQKYLEEHSTVSLQSAYGISKFARHFEDLPWDILPNLVQLTLSVLINCVTHGPGADETALSSLKTAVCDFIGSTPNVFTRLLSLVADKISESSEDSIAVLLKVCLMVLTEEFRKVLLMDSEASGCLHQIIHLIRSKGETCTELETLIADLEYRCSTVTFTIS